MCVSAFMRNIQFGPGYTPFPVVDSLLDRYHIDAIDRAGRKAEFTTGALIGDDCVHVFGGAENCIDRAGLDTQGATDAGFFVD